MSNQNPTRPASFLFTLLAAGSRHALACALLLPAVAIAQTTPIGLSEVGGQWFPSALPAIGDQLGGSVAAGDFNGDGAQDLATGIPFADEAFPDDALDSGAVLVRFAIEGRGLSAATVMLRETAADSNSDEHFGQAVAAGDFNGDGFDDLAVGIPNDLAPGAPQQARRRGAVRVYYGYAGGLQLENSELITATDAGEIESHCDPYVWSHWFGWSLAVGNFDADAYDDLAIGAPFSCEQLDPLSVSPGGAVFVGHGQDWGLHPWYGYRISQDSPGLFDEVEADDLFGWSVAAGDFNGDAFDDLAVGVPMENDSGAVQNVMGSQWGLIFVHSVFWLPGALGEVAQEGASLGAALGSGDFDGDGYDDLAIGSPNKYLDAQGAIRSGAVNIAYGAADPNWFDLGRANRISQGVLFGNPGHDGHLDYFGSEFAVGDFDRDGADDLAIGSYGDDWPGIDHGAVTIVMGGGPYLGAAARYRLLGTGWEGLPGDPTQHGQYSGQGLAAGDFDGNGYSDLAIGVPRYDLQGVANAGAVAALYGALFADGFELGALDRWSSALP